jgi:hypothetical protein
MTDRTHTTTSGTTVSPSGDTTTRKSTESTTVH